jgi:hypothetical protein
MKQRPIGNNGLTAEHTWMLRTYLIGILDPSNCTAVDLYREYYETSGGDRALKRKTGSLSNINKLDNTKPESNSVSQKGP